MAKSLEVQIDDRNLAGSPVSNLKSFGSSDNRLLPHSCSGQEGKLDALEMGSVLSRMTLTFDILSSMALGPVATKSREFTHLLGHVFRSALVCQLQQSG
jgi:hypothetical protein